MVELSERRILIDGKPRLVVCGEVHYFRLKREEWQDRLDKLKEAGCNAVASYIPWLCHQFREEEIDLEGRTRPELDLGAFIDLCKENGLYFMARPGPFIMAEMKNEGLPYWVYTKHPEIVPVTWDGKQAPTRTVDYLAPGFLEEVRGWYQAVMGVIAPRLHTNGGNIIALQLDNEIGMLAWISNSPDLTAGLLDDFAGWLGRRYDREALKVRYPFPMENSEIQNVEMRSPGEGYAAELMRDLGHYMRDRFARYVDALRGYAEEFGVTGVPLVINVHGTEAGRAFSFPIGISQLYEAYTQGPGPKSKVEGQPGTALDIGPAYVAGSDHYIGDLTMRNFQDLYLINALMEAVNNSDQPLTSVEFEAGSGDYSGSYGGRHDPSSVDFKVRMCVAQGNRLLNFYLFTGGINYHLEEPVHDGNDRISFTGERHGVAAPVNPEGELSYTFPRLARAVGVVMAVGDKLAEMEEERDNVALAFIPDYYMTEYHYPGSGRVSAIVENLEANRGPDAWEIVVKAMLLAGYRFGAVDVQNRPLDPERTPVLVVASAHYMDGGVQRKLVDFMSRGGRVLLYGEVPLADMEGRSCTTLAEALGLTPLGTRHASRHYYLSVLAQGWAAPRAEVPTHRAQLFEPSRGEVLLRAVGTDEACGFDVEVGQGRAVVITAAYKCDVPFFRAALEKLGAVEALRHDCPQGGIFMTSSASKDGERFLHVLNLDNFDKEFHLLENGQALFEGRNLLLRGREGVMLPLGVSLGDVRIVYSTAEIARVEDHALELRLTQPEDVVVVETGREIVPSEEYSVEVDGGRALVTSRRPAVMGDRLKLRWR